jgi:hypothetical protein
MYKYIQYFLVSKWANKYKNIQGPKNMRVSIKYNRLIDYFSAIDYAKQ